MTDGQSEACRMIHTIEIGGSYFAKPTNDYVENMETEAACERGNRRRQLEDKCWEANVTNSKRKGKSGELELAHTLSHLFGVACRRGQQFSGVEGKDVVGLPGVHIECKRTERLKLQQAYEQALRDRKPKEIPVVCHRQSNNPWMITLCLGDLPKLATLLERLRTQK